MLYELSNDLSQAYFCLCEFLVELRYAILRGSCADSGSSFDKSVPSMHQPPSSATSIMPSPTVMASPSAQCSHSLLRQSTIRQFGV